MVTVDCDASDVDWKAWIVSLAFVAVPVPVPWRSLSLSELDKNIVD